MVGKNCGKELDIIRDVGHNDIMTRIRKAIIKQMKELGLNPNQLSEMLKGKIPRQTIYDFLSEQTDTRTEVASALMEALDLELRPRKK